MGRRVYRPELVTPKGDDGQKIINGFVIRHAKFWMVAMSLDVPEEQPGVRSAEQNRLYFGGHWLGAVSCAIAELK